MNFKELKNTLSQHPKILELQKLLDQDKQKIQVNGIKGSFDAIAGALCHNKDGITFFILPDKEEAAYFLNDISKLHKETPVFLFPSSYKNALKYNQIDKANIQLRTEVMDAIQEHRPYIIVTYPEAIVERVITQDTLKQKTLNLSTGNEISLDEIMELMARFNFERVDFVYEPGQFSVRGSIVDIFSFSSELPFRIDLFGDEIESIRSFDIESQLSKDKLNNISILPDIHSIKEEKQSFLEMIPEKTLFWIKEAGILKQKVNSVYEVGLQHRKDENDPIAFDHSDEFLNKLAGFPVIEYNLPFYYLPEHTIEFDTKPQPAFNKNFEMLGNNLKENEEKKYQNIILSNNQKQIERLNAIFQDINHDVHFEPLLDTLHEGFIDNDAKICCYTDHQIFGRYYRSGLKHGFSKKESLTIRELSDLHPGDYVVHTDHGIGTFGGLQKIDNNGKQQEAVKLIYKDNDSLFVSIHALHKISKYKGKEGEPPKIYKLGSGAWQALKQKTKQKVKDIARELIQLYALRKQKKGFAFSPDSYLQKELEASFIYEDTPDQHKTTNSIKEAMESQIPMDFLVCGDVGFGKTEVAIRAAFKAVANSKQVAVLVPTTILALQHHNTFTERLKDFPCNIDFISRLKTTKDQKQTIENIKNGKIDIIIGTHRIISNDIQFKDLGLLIIDEEQKFGVTVKEKLKKIKLNVDTLTLTATPIPRTLQFSLMGARDLSVIYTPPPNRHPIITGLYSFNEETIREAIYYETSRNGQVFFIHNWVHNIKGIEQYIQKVCPDIRTAIAHGQMKPAELENIILDFINGDYDVLIATTIIENGLDIPNANTIIINNAQNFGVSDLHQLRGRVGRSNKKAYCYLLAPPLATLPAPARRRLKAIESFSELGRGFNITMKDLDKRGAGNLLGRKQSGFISDIGFETYHRILDEALHELKQNEYKDVFNDENKNINKQETDFDSMKFVNDCQIVTDMELLFPDHYISNATERIHLYRKLDNMKQEEELQTFEHELTDRFGKLPPPSKDLLEVVRLRWLAMDLGFEKLILKNRHMIAYFVTDQESPYYQSPVFKNILENIQKDHKKYNLEEKNNKLTLSFNNITDIYKAWDALSEIYQKQKATVE